MTSDTAATRPQDAGDSKATRQTNAIAVSHRIYDLLTAATTVNPPSMRSWTGETWGPPDAAATIVLRHPAALRAALLPATDLSAGEAYIYDDIDIEGDLFSLLRWAAALDVREPGPVPVLQLLRLLRRLPKPPRRARPRARGRLHSLRRDRASVRHHYDTGNDFFAGFLDPALVYSSAYYLDGDDKLATAQRRKLDVICRKLQLQPGQRMLDVGCGWGALSRHAAAHYGVRVLGVTLSPEQAREAERRNAAAGLQSTVTIQVKDYREVDETFDAIASVGMFEHVGATELGVYFSNLFRRLRPGGALLNHGITTRDRPTGRRRRRPSFVGTYVFPDGELAPLETGIAAAERAGFETRDVESLRASYALTLRAWVDNLESSRAGGLIDVDEVTYRIWRMYMAGSAVAFETSAISVYQALYVRPERTWSWGRAWMLAGDDH